MKAEEGPTDEGKDYLWYEMGFFTIWKSNACMVLCIDTPPELRAGLEDFLTVPQPPSFELQDPFAMLRPLFDEIIKVCNENAWRVTKLVRDIERVRCPLHDGHYN